MAAEQQTKKIHPVDVEAATSPTAPLAPRKVFLGSEKGEYPAHHPTPPTISHSRPSKQRRCGRCCCQCCCRCLCWTFFILLLLAVVAVVLYLVFKPKPPMYSVDRLRISALTIDPANLNVSASFDVTVTATNPNQKIGIYYEGDNHLSVWYSGTSLCAGTFPAFYQGHRNTTVANVELNGQTQVDSDLLRALQAATTQQTGSVPLLFQSDVPVRVKLGLLKLWKVRFLVNCDLVVNSLKVSSQVTISTSSCKLKLKL